MNLFKKLAIAAAFLSTATIVNAQEDGSEFQSEPSYSEPSYSEPAPSYPAPPAPKAAPSSDEGDFKIGFYSSIGNNNIKVGEHPITGDDLSVNSVGVLFNLGNGLEINLGIGFYNSSTTTETNYGTTTIKDENSGTIWAIIPGVSYQLGKNDFIRYGVGLDITLASYSETTSSGGTSKTEKPESMFMSFLPNFGISAEIVKNFEIGLKTGLAIDIPPGVDTPVLKESTLIFRTQTEILFKYYL